MAKDFITPEQYQRGVGKIKKYVDDNIGNVPLKKIISTEQSPIVISELSDGIYDFGTTAFVKMFSSDTKILKNVLGICILYSISDVKKILFVNFKSNIALFNVEDRYALDIKNKTYTLLQFTKLISIGGSSSTPVVLLDEITENGGDSFGLYQTTCSSLKLTADSKTVSLDNGSKILLVTSTSVKEITTYQINSFGAFSIKKIKYEYNKNTKEATLISDDSAVFNKELEDTKYNLQKVTNYINDIYDNRLTVLNTNIKNATYVNNDITNNANITRYFNIDKTLDILTDFDTCFINLKYYMGVLRTYSFKTSFNKTYNHFSVLGNTADCKIVVELVVDKQVNEKLEVIDAPGKCYFDIKYARNAEDYAIKAIDSGNVEVQLSSNKILKIDNKHEYTPTGDYNPATKKYVDDNKVIVPTNISEFTNDSKYINQIKVLPVEYDNDKMVNVQNLEPHSIYIVPSDIDYLDLGCMGESNRLVTVLATPNTEEFIYTGNKTDKYISFRFGARTHTIYFKTDTSSSRIERYPYYLTPSNNEAYTPKNDYNPTTKKYVDDLVESSKIVICTDEEVDNMLNEVLGGDYSGN